MREKVHKIHSLPEDSPWDKPVPPVGSHEHPLSVRSLDRVMAVQRPLVVAHIHEPWVVEEGRRMAFNPGSVGQPFNGDPRAHYALLGGRRGRWCVEQQALATDLDRLRVAYTESGYLTEGGALARACLETALSGSNHIMPFLHHAYRLAAERGFGERRIVPDAVWLEAVASWRWNGNTAEGGP